MEPGGSMGLDGRSDMLTIRCGFNAFASRIKIMLEIITGDLLEATEKYIAHNCNCLTQNSAGTAKAIFDKFPYANTYERRARGADGETANKDVPGTIAILGNGQDQRFIINMYAMYYPGRSKYPTSSLD